MHSPQSYAFFVHNRSAATLFLAFSLLLCGCATVAPHTPPTAPALALSTTSFNFNTVVIGQSAKQTLHISNTGSAPMTIESLSLESQQFSFTGPSVPRTVLPAQSVDYTISFVPTSSGNLSASLKIITDASDTPAAVSLAGVGEKAFAALQVTPPSINFASLVLQKTDTQTVTLKNTGDINLTINGVTVAGGSFGYSNLSPGLSLSPNQSVSFQIWFRPTVPGLASGTISILSANLSSPASIGVSGDGVNSTTTPPPTTPPPTTPPPTTPPPTTPPPTTPPPTTPPPTTPPSPSAEHSVSLSWDASSSSSIAGYRIYRSSVTNISFAPLTSVIPGLAYIDSTVSSGNTYFYVVTAVDSAGDESSYSNQVTAVIP